MHSIIYTIDPLPEQMASAIEQGPGKVCEAAPDLLQRPPWELLKTMLARLILDQWVDAEGMVGQRDALRTARAVNRYRHDHGELPESLDVLVPEYIDAVPCESVSGTPFKLQEEDNIVYLNTISPDLEDSKNTFDYVDCTLWRFYKEPLLY